MFIKKITEFLKQFYFSPLLPQVFQLHCLSPLLDEEHSSKNYSFSEMGQIQIEHSHDTK